MNLKLLYSTVHMILRRPILFFICCTLAFETTTAKSYAGPLDFIMWPVGTLAAVAYRGIPKAAECARELEDTARRFIGAAPLPLYSPPFIVTTYNLSRLSENAIMALVMALNNPALRNIDNLAYDGRGFTFNYYVSPDIGTPLTQSLSLIMPSRRLFTRMLYEKDDGTITIVWRDHSGRSYYYPPLWH